MPSYIALDVNADGGGPCQGSRAKKPLRMTRYSATLTPLVDSALLVWLQANLVDAFLEKMEQESI